MSTPLAVKTRRPLITAPREVGWFEAELPGEVDPGAVRLRARMTLISPGTELRLFRGDPMVGDVWESFARLDVSTPRQRTNTRYVVTNPNKPGEPRYPVTFGYNTVAEVVELGAGVEGLDVGQRVMTVARHQELVDLLAWEVTPIPDEVSDEAAAFSYIATLGLHALRRAHFRPGENVVVIGLGLVGLCAALVVEAVGAPCICLDTDADRLLHAREALPAGFVQDPRSENFFTELETRLDPNGVDVVLDAAQGAASLDTGMRILDHRGRMAVIALHPEDVGPLLSSDFYSKGTSIIGTGNDAYANPHERTHRFTIAGNIAYLLDLQRRGRLPLERVRTHVFPADRLDTAYQAMADGRRDMVGVLLDWR
jgi:threonine dehydrogenase-like Zn-dependent dehydrogenase